MQNGKGIALGFVAGLVVSVGAVLLLREPEVPASDDARIAGLSAKIESLERSLSRLAPATGGPAPARQAGDYESPPGREESNPVVPEQQKVIASAHDMVDQAIQTGQWTKLQARELSELTAELSAEEQGRIHARISAAINNDQIRPELP